MALRPLLSQGAVYDSSCSPEARVLFVDANRGYYLKSAPRGTLKNEAVMTDFFYQKGLGTRVLCYLSEAEDWLLTERVRGEDCTHPAYLANPRRLCDILGERLRALHETDFAGCPVTDRMASYCRTVEQNYQAGRYDGSLLTDGYGFTGAEEAWRLFSENRHRFSSDVLLHGDYCLPNVMLDDWQFSGFIDLGNGGVGDRHVDLFWGVWTLLFNLKTDAYRDRFLDAYGRDAVELDKLRLVAAAEVFG